MTDPQPTPGLYGAPETAPATAQAPTLMEQVLGIYTEPVQLFRRLQAAPVWLGATVVSFVVGLVMTVIWAMKVDVDALVRPILESNPQLSADQVDKMISFQAKIILPGSIFGVVVGVSLGLLLGGLIYWAIGKGTAEAQPPTFRQAVSVAAVSGLALVPHNLLVTVMCFLKPVAGLGPEKIPPSSLGYFLAVESPKLHSLLYRLDLFTLFSLVLLYLGARHALRLKTAGAAACAGATGFLMIILPALFGR